MGMLPTSLQERLTPSSPAVKCAAHGYLGVYMNMDVEGAYPHLVTQPFLSCNNVNVGLSIPNVINPINNYRSTDLPSASPLTT